MSEHELDRWDPQDTVPPKPKATTEDLPDLKLVEDPEGRVSLVHEEAKTSPSANTEEDNGALLRAMRDALDKLRP